VRSAVQRPAELRSIGDDEYRPRPVECVDEIGKHLVAGLVDPMGILEREHGSIRACPNGMRHDFDQSAAPTIGADLEEVPWCRRCPWPRTGSARRRSAARTAP